MEVCSLDREAREEASLCYYPGMNKILMYEEFIR